MTEERRLVSREADHIYFCQTCGKTRFVEWLHRDCPPDNSAALPQPATEPALDDHDHEWIAGWLKNENLPDHVRWSESQQWPDDIAWLGCSICERPKPLAAQPSAALPQSATEPDPTQPHGVSGLFHHEPGAPCVVCDRLPQPATEPALTRFRFVPDTFDSLARMEVDPVGEWVQYAALAGSGLGDDHAA